MAKNLQAKLPPKDSVQIFDLNKEAAQRLAQEMKTSQAGGATVEVAESVNDAARDSVCPLSFPQTLSSKERGFWPICFDQCQLGGPCVSLQIASAVRGTLRFDILPHASLYKC